MGKRYFQLYQRNGGAAFAMKELLKDDGVIVVHLDWHAVHYARLVMDEIFGADNFINEVIWKL